MISFPKYSFAQEVRTNFGKHFFNNFKRKISPKQKNSYCQNPQKRPHSRSKRSHDLTAVLKTAFDRKEEFRPARKPTDTYIL